MDPPFRAYPFQGRHLPSLRAPRAIQVVGREVHSRSMSIRREWLATARDSEEAPASPMELSLLATSGRVDMCQDGVGCGGGEKRLEELRLTWFI